MISETNLEVELATLNASIEENRRLRTSVGNTVEARLVRVNRVAEVRNDLGMDYLMYASPTYAAVRLLVRAAPTMASMWEWTTLARDTARASSAANVSTQVATELSVPLDEGDNDDDIPCENDLLAPLGSCDEIVTMQGELIEEEEKKKEEVALVHGPACSDGTPPSREERPKTKLHLYLIAGHARKVRMRKLTRNAIALLRLNFGVPSNTEANRMMIRRFVMKHPTIFRGIRPAHLAEWMPRIVNLALTPTESEIAEMEALNPGKSFVNRVASFLGWFPLVERVQTMDRLRGT